MKRNNEHTTQDRDEIIAWAQRRSGYAAVVAGAHPDAADADIDPEIGTLRLGFPGYASEEKLDPISWDEFFETFAAHQAAFYYEDALPDGTTSYRYHIITE